MSQQGNCPQCGEPLHYDGRVLANDDGHAEPVSCTKCDWHGYENYRETFLDHEDPEPDDPAFAPPWTPAFHVAQEYKISPPPQDDAGEGRHNYRVVYEIDLYAASPLEAAREVERIWRDPEAIPAVVTVIEPDGKRTDVDLFAEGLEERWGLTVDIVRADHDPPAEAAPTPGPTPA